MQHIPIIYENDEIIIINKQQGISVQGGVGIVHPLDKELAKQLRAPVFLVHRLDKDTSGLMIVAKTHKAASMWTKLVASREVQKEYDAVCIGKFTEKFGTVTDSVVEHGILKNAITYYTVTTEKEIVCASSEVLNLSLVHLVLGTGRMHQIRIHLAKRGCPIAGDDKHGDFARNKLLRKTCGVKTLLLAATSLTLPLDGGARTFAVPLPDSFAFFSCSW